MTIQRIEQGKLRPPRQVVERLSRTGALPDASGEQQPDMAPGARSAQSLLPTPLTPLIGRVQEVAAVGAAFVDLAPIGDPDLVASSIAQAFGLKQAGGQPLIVALQRSLRDKRWLLLNCTKRGVLRVADRHSSYRS